MIIKFCNNCDNLLYIYTDSEQQLYLACKSCGNKEKYIEKNINILNKKKDLDISLIINNNNNLTNDITLPEINGNPNIKCTNTECISIKEKLPSKITYYKYDLDNIKYIYIYVNIVVKNGKINLNI